MLPVTIWFHGHCALTKHWTPTLRSCEEHYEPYQNFLTAVHFPGSLFLLNVNHASSQKNTRFVIYFCPGMKVCHIFPLFYVLTYTHHYWGTFFFYITLQHYFPLCRSVAKSFLLTNSTIHHSVHLLCTVQQVQSHKLLPFIIPALSHFERYSLFNWIYFTSMVHVLTDDYH
jgi:hypothetical protein